MNLMKNICLVVISLLCTGSKVEIEEIEKAPISDLLNGKFLIKSEYDAGNEYLYLSDARKNEDKVVVEAKVAIQPESIFIFKKRPQGYLIINQSTDKDMYMYVAGPYGSKDEGRIVEFRDDITAGSYFNIFDVDPALQRPLTFHIQNDRSKDNLRVSYSRNIVKCFETEDEQSFFSFVPYKKKYFNKN